MSEESRSGAAWRVLKRLMVLGLVTIVLLGAAAMLFEEKFIFFPTRHPDGPWDAPERMGFVAEDSFFEASDGVRLHAWWCTPTGELEPEMPVMLFFHGNAGNLSYRVDNVGRLVQRGVAVFIIDYRGYGRSDDQSPNEEGAYRDGEAAWRFLTEEKGIEPGRIVIFGRSLGGGVATEMARRHPDVAGLILESTFRSVPHIASQVFPIFPAGMLMRTRFDNLEKIADLDLPILIVHGTEDELIPFSEGQALHQAAPDDRVRELFSVEGGTHNDTWAVGGERYLKRIVGFCREVTGDSR